MAAEYKETVARRYYTVTGERAEESKIEAMIASGESETFLQKAIQRGQGRGEVLGILSEIQERHDAVKDIERSLLELHQVFLDMAALVEAQGQREFKSRPTAISPGWSGYRSAAGFWCRFPG